MLYLLRGAQCRDWCECQDLVQNNIAMIMFLLHFLFFFVGCSAESGYVLLTC